jgi:excisionase family DNA binding protein
MKNLLFTQVSPEELKTLINEALASKLKSIQLSSATSHEDYLTTVEVSQLFKISISTVHNWRKAGTLVACQIGGRVYFKRTDIDNAVVQLKS